VHQIELEMQNEELRNARVELEAGLERYTELFDFAPIGYVILDVDLTIRELNHTGARLLGRARARVIGSRFESLVATPDRAMFSEVVNRAHLGEAREHCDVRLVQGANAAEQVRIMATVLTRAQAQVLLAFEDITEEKAREERLQRSENALREADRRKDEFLAVLSHELRNPLEPIRNSLYVLTHADPAREEARQARVIVDRQVTHLTRLVDDLLDVTRIMRGKIQLRRERVELGDLVRRTLDDHRASFERSGLGLEGRFESRSFWVEADPARLVQALSNLLGNAEKFTPKGGQVLVTLEREGGNVILVVRDTGAGIAPEVRGHLFEPFTQAPQTMDRSRGGLGLGLAMVKGLVDLHGGTIGISSEGPGRGTEVSVSLPLEAQPAPVTTPTEPVPARCRKVLVIEDNVDSAESLMYALSISGHEVQVAYDGPTGLAFAREFRPEIVICDIGLPVMDGYAVAKAFRAEPMLKGTYLIALSGYAQPDDLQRATRAGFDDHVAKPTRLEKLDRLLAKAPSPASDDDDDDEPTPPPTRLD
jgi:two-component system CheB/CheR fusion protein